MKNEAKFLLRRNARNGTFSYRGKTGVHRVTRRTGWRTVGRYDTAEEALAEFKKKVRNSLDRWDVVYREKKLIANAWTYGM